MHICTRIYMSCPYMPIYRRAHIRKTPLWKWPTSIYASSIYAHLWKPLFVYASFIYVHIWKVHIWMTHIRKKFMIIQMHLPYMCASIYAHLRNLSFVNAHFYMHLYESSVYVNIHRHAYMGHAIMEVRNFPICIVYVCAFTKVFIRICIVYICVYTEERIYIWCIYGQHI